MSETKSWEVVAQCPYGVREGGVESFTKDTSRRRWIVYKFLESRWVVFKFGIYYERTDS